MEEKKYCKPFNLNLKHYILANNMTRQGFADKLNNYLQENMGEAKIYDGNMIWTYDSRGSFPKDGKVLVAIAKIIGIPLEDMLIKTYTVEELRIEQKKKPECVHGILEYCVNEPDIYDETRLKVLPDDLQGFLCGLIGDRSLAGYHVSLFDVGIVYNCNGKVTVSLCSGDDSIYEMALQWDKEEYDGELKRFEGDKCRVLKEKIESEIFQKLVPLDIVGSVECSIGRAEELPQARGETIDDYFICKATIDVKGVPFCRRPRRRRPNENS